MMVRKNEAAWAEHIDEEHPAGLQATSTPSSMLTRWQKPDDCSASTQRQLGVIGFLTAALDPSGVPKRKTDETTEST
ncbi:hypothetical protein EYF80_002905 [Liparis tanakae]|uniref:Uncharacterized protein n=1 Tax=Liparis tanakae TaxID=230148 RepID=A0A4Z2JBN6_9TELE|nr:hypothetical protein EYF80_002905 [Liparis tanakae]